MSFVWRLARWTSVFMFLPAFSQIVSNHLNSDLGLVNPSSVEAAKGQFRIWYGHTSHGSQITSGMSVLASDFPTLYNYNSNGSGGALSYQETYGDLGHNGDLAWEAATRQQLNRPDNDRNMVVWSWCGGVSDNTVEGINTYLDAMNQLELDYPNVTFIYMTGHLDGTGEGGNLHRGNNQIRQFCQDQGKVLFDFADIESFDPDDHYFLDLNADDGCNYWLGGVQRNWADEWCAAHPGECSSVSCAHSRSLNCDRKGIAFWWLLSQLAEFEVCVDSPSGVSSQVLAGSQTIRVNWSSSTPVDSFQIQRRVDGGAWQESYRTVAGNVFFMDDAGLADGSYSYRVLGHLNDGGNGSPCDSVPSAVTTSSIATQPPSAPSSLVANYSSSGVSLLWNDHSSNEEGFRIEKSIEGAGFAEAGHVNANVAQWLDTNISPLSNLEYRVYAWNSNGNSPFSNIAEVSIPEETFTLRLETNDDVDDAFLDPNNPDTFYGDVPYVSEMFHFILKFNFPEDMALKTILEAKLAFFGWGQSNWQPGQTLDLFRVSSNWEEPSVTWNQACDCANWNVPGGDFDSTHVLAQVPITEGCDHCFYPEVDVTEMVQSWIDECQPNHGFILVNNSLTHTSLKASEYNPGQRTYLEITFSNETHSAGGFFFEVCSSWCSPDMNHPGYDLDGNGVINLLDLLLIESSCGP